MSIISISKPLPPIESDACDDRSSPVLNFTKAWELAKTSEVLDIVQGLLTHGGASVMFGPSNLGKSFWILDLAAAIATGREFRDELETDQGAVLYFSLEGRLAFQNRLDALRFKGLIEEATPLFISFDGIDLSMRPEKDGFSYGEMIVETIRQIEENEGCELKLVVIDTLSRALGGGDENSGRDMMIAVGELDYIRRKTSAHVAIVHHTGKDQLRGARGHSSLRASVDTEIELSRELGETVTTVRCTKQRDMVIPAAMPFSLEIIELGSDRRGNAITSCIVRHDDEMMASKSKGAGRPATTTVAELLKLLPQPRTKEWQQVAKDELGLRETAFHSLLKSIKEKKSATFTKADGWKLPGLRFGNTAPLPL